MLGEQKCGRRSLAMYAARRHGGLNAADALAMRVLGRYNIHGSLAASRRPVPYCHRQLLEQQPVLRPRRSSSNTTLSIPATWRSQKALPLPLQATATSAPLDPGSGPTPQGSLYQPMTDIQPFQGNIRLEQIPGAGLGWVATQQLQAGELLMISPPLAILHSSEAESHPLGLELVDYLEQMQAQRMLSEAQQAWLHLLQSSTGEGSQEDSSRGAGSSGQEVAGPSGQGMEQEWRLRQVQRLIRAELPSSSSSSSSAAADLRVEFDVASLPALSREALALKTSANSYGNPCQDPAVMVARQMPDDQYPGGHVGIYPWFSFFNHSCCPNATYMVIDSSMVIRAAAEVAPGEQVCVSYIGPRVLEPLEQRQEYLQAAYGFGCGCPRCGFEGRLPGALAAHLARSFAACRELREAAPAALEAGDVRAAFNMDRSLFQAWEALHDVVSDLSVPGEIQAGEQAGSNPEGAAKGVSLQQLSWLEASMWCVLQLQQAFFDHDVLPESVALAAEVVGAVAPGSDLHLTLASRHLLTVLRLQMAAAAPPPPRGRSKSKSRSGGRRAAKAADEPSLQPAQLELQLLEAAEGCRAAYNVRFGPVLPRTLQLLMLVNLSRVYSREEVQALLQRLFASKEVGGADSRLEP